jgi:hypothetical protein
MEARAHSGTKRSRKNVTRDKPKNGLVVVTYVDPQAIQAARDIVASPENSYTRWAIEAGEVWVR